MDAGASIVPQLVSDVATSAENVTTLPIIGVRMEFHEDYRCIEHAERLALRGEIPTFASQRLHRVGPAGPRCGLRV
jgi:hypothetical protein